MKKRSKKQQVITQYPKAKCFELWPDSRLYLVALDGVRPVVGTKEEYDRTADANYSGNAPNAWERAAEQVAAQNALDTNSPFMRVGRRQ